MPAGPRIRANNVYGTISDNPLLIGAVSFTSLGLALLPAVSAQHAVLVFDPKRVFGEPEIVVVTSHLALGTTATITRAQYGTVARAHPQGTAWAHVPVGPDDYTAIVTSGTRPSNPYQGQMIYETDTDSFVGRSAAATWQTVVGLGAWTSWVPALTAVTTSPTLGTASTQTGNYSRMGRTINSRCRITFGTSGVVAGSGHYMVSLPVTAATPTGPASDFQPNVIGLGMIYDFSAGFWFPVTCQVNVNEGMNVCKLWSIDTSAASPQMFRVSSGQPFTWSTQDEIVLSYHYEAAT